MPDNMINSVAMQILGDQKKTTFILPNWVDTPV
jgi:hypothetical protein